MEFKTYRCYVNYFVSRTEMVVGKVSEYTMNGDTSIPCVAIILLFATVHTMSLVDTAIFSVYRPLRPPRTCMTVKVRTDLRLFLRLRMRGVLFKLPLYLFSAWR